MIEIDGITLQNHIIRPQTDLNDLWKEPAIILVDANTFQTDPRGQTKIHFWNLPNSKETENGDINLSETASRVEHTENNHTEYQIEETTEDIVYIDLNDWLILDETRHTTDIDQLLPTTDPTFNLLEHLEMD